MPALAVLRRVPPVRLLGRIVGGCVALSLMVFAGQASFSASSPSSYVVRAGDNLWAISRAHQLNVSQLAAANGLTSKTPLPIGKRLTIPSTTAGSSTAATRASSGASYSSANFCATLRVGSGPAGVLPAGLADNPTRLALRPYFVTYAARYGVSSALAEAIAWQESGWQEGEVSSARAVGVGQLLPSTAQFVSRGLIGTNLDIASAADNIRMEVRYLAYLQSHLGGRCATIAGYYEGLKNMLRSGVLPESRAYVISVESLIARFE